MGAMEHFKPLLIGQDPARIRAHLAACCRVAGSFPAQRILTSAMSAIDIALWDIKGKALGRAGIRAAWAERCATRWSAIHTTSGHRHGDRAAGRVLPADQGDGWKFVRWGLPQDGSVLEPRQAVRAAIAQFQAVREAVGDEIDICFDVHTRLDLPDAFWLCRGSGGTRSLLHRGSACVRESRLVQDTCGRAPLSRWPRASSSAPSGSSAS